MISRSKLVLVTTLGCFAAVFSLAGIGLKTTAAATGTATWSDAIHTLEGMATTSGALGLYLDPSGNLVVVMPSGTASAFDLAAAQSLGLAVELRTLPLTLSALQDIDNSITAIASATPRASYAWAFDLKSGLVTVTTDGDVGSLAGIVNKYPTQIEVTPGTVAIFGGRNADTSPFWGGRRNQ